MSFDAENAGCCREDVRRANGLVEAAEEKLLTALAGGRGGTSPA